jgi:hypothetical protein
MNVALLERFCQDIQTGFAQGDPGHAEKDAEAHHVQVLIEQYQAIMRGDVAAILASMTEDVEMEVIGPPALPWSGRWKGRDNVLAALGSNLSTIESHHLEVQSVTAQGDTVVVVAREQGVYLPSGRPYEVHWVQLFTFANGQLKRFREIIDSGSVLSVFQV